jgi:hypothetical protein
MKKAISTIALIPLSLGGIAFSSLQAHAANIGPVGIPCNGCLQFSTAGAGGSSVNFSIDNKGTADPLDDEVTFSFTPSFPGNNINISGAAGNPFGGFINNPNTTVADIGTLPLIFPGGEFVFATPQAFLYLDGPGAADGEDIFFIERILQPAFVDDEFGSAEFRTRVFGHFQSGDGTLYNGSLTINSTFDNQTVAQVLAQASAGTVSTSWSGTGSISPRVLVPEPSAVLGLVAIFGSGVMLRKKSR